MTLREWLINPKQNIKIEDLKPLMNALTCLHSIEYVPATLTSALETTSIDKRCWVYHGDVNPNNAVFSEGKGIQVFDYSNSAVLDQKKMTAGWNPPECQMNLLKEIYGIATTEEYNQRFGRARATWACAPSSIKRLNGWRRIS